jgi:hypothetical protein
MIRSPLSIVAYHNKSLELGNRGKSGPLRLPNNNCWITSLSTNVNVLQGNREKVRFCKELYTKPQYRC